MHVCMFVCVYFILILFIIRFIQIIMYTIPLTIYMPKPPPSHSIRQSIVNVLNIFKHRISLYIFIISSLPSGRSRQAAVQKFQVVLIGGSAFMQPPTAIYCFLSSSSLVFCLTTGLWHPTSPLKGTLLQLLQHTNPWYTSRPPFYPPSLQSFSS